MNEEDTGGEKIYYIFSFLVAAGAPNEVVLALAPVHAHALLQSKFRAFKLNFTRRRTYDRGRSRREQSTFALASGLALRASRDDVATVKLWDVLTVFTDCGSIGQDWSYR